MTVSRGLQNSSRLFKGIILSIVVLESTRMLMELTIIVKGFSAVDGENTERRNIVLQETNDIENSRSLLSPTFYIDTYRYNAPFKAVNASDTPSYPTYNCGSKPHFSTFFSNTSKYRSYLNEDNIVYETFFKEHIARDDTFKGTYVELTFDGMRNSNTRFFDLCLGWEGLLIDVNPKMYDMLNINRPNAHKMSFAPSCKKAGEIIQFRFSPAASVNRRLVRDAKKYDDEAHLNVNVPCGPLSPVLEDVFADHGMHINFFALDMDGSEDVVLKTIDFEKVKIDVLMVGLKNDDCTYGKCKVRDNVREIMEKAGYARLEGFLLSESLDVYTYGKSRFQIDTTGIDHPAPRDTKISNTLPSSTEYHNLPNIQMIGVGRAATTAISEWLYGQSMTSPSGVCRPTVFDQEPSFFNKEVHFFDHSDRYSQGIEFYAKRFDSCGKHRFTMDATPDTFRHPKHVHDTYHQIGGSQHDELKIILILREPNYREFSHYNNMKTEYLKKPSSKEWYGAIESSAGSAMSFDDYVEKVIKSDVVNINDLPMSLYSHNLGEWTKYFNRNQILIVNYDEVRKSPEWAQHRIRKFLGSTFPGELPGSNLNDPPKLKDLMSCSAQTKLNMLFEATTVKLYNFLDQNPGQVMEQSPFPKFQPPLCAEMYSGKYRENIKYKLPNIQIIGAPKTGTTAVSILIY